MAGDAVENYSEPILEGAAPSDYERYLNTEELLALQKGPGEWVHRDELLFQVTHQSSELWLKHACAEVEEATRLIEARDGTRVGLASDLGHVDLGVLQHLSNCDGLFFEANHDVDMLRMGTYPWSLKRRIMSRFGHLSNDDALRAVQRMIGADTKTLCLIHLSQKNNHESIVRDMATRLLARTGAQLELGIAKQFEPTGAFKIARRSPRASVVPRGVQMALF